MSYVKQPCVKYAAISEGKRFAYLFYSVSIYSHDEQWLAAWLVAALLL